MCSASAILMNNMEGTRNERVAIVLTAYVIGFITAYIAFGVMQLESSVKFAQVPAQNTALVIASQNTDMSVELTESGLFLLQGNERTLISAASDSGLAEGTHVDISNYSLSDDESQVYFCELPTLDSESCRPYIYSINDAVVYPVTVGNERVAYDALNHKVSWNEARELVVD